MPRPVGASDDDGSRGSGANGQVQLQMERGRVAARTAGAVSGIDDTENDKGRAGAGMDRPVQGRALTSRRRLLRLDSSHTAVERPRRRVRVQCFGFVLNSLCDSPAEMLFGWDGCDGIRPPSGADWIRSEARFGLAARMLRILQGEW